MDLPTVQDRLAGLPDTFRRSGATYASWEFSFAVGLARYTTAADQVSAQENFNLAQGKWLDVWGQLLGVPRFPAEENGVYANRIQATLLGWVGTVPGIEACLQLQTGAFVPVQESIPTTAGWSAALPPSLTGVALAQLVEALDYVRPAGVPYALTVSIGGLYLSTQNFFTRGRVTGAFLVSPFGGVALPGGPTTNNTVPNLPTLFLTDPTLNGT